MIISSSTGKDASCKTHSGRGSLCICGSQALADRKAPASLVCPAPRLYPMSLQLHFHLQLGPGSKGSKGEGPISISLNSALYDLQKGQSRTGFFFILGISRVPQERQRTSYGFIQMLTNRRWYTAPQCSHQWNTTQLASNNNERVLYLWDTLFTKGKVQSNVYRRLLLFVFERIYNICRISLDECTRNWSLQLPLGRVWARKQGRERERLSKCPLYIFW